MQVQINLMADGLVKNSVYREKYEKSIPMTDFL
jgi:hypothetical protein